MEDNRRDPYLFPSSESCEETTDSREQFPYSLLRNMEALLYRLLNTTPSCSNNTATKLIRFDPDENDADIEGWCRVTEVIVKSRKLEGAELLLALTHALQGRAATCLTKLQTSQLTWDQIKEILVAKFVKPMLPQDFFDEILGYQVNPKETACETATRLWTKVERIPRTEMPEDVITGFVCAVLCQKDDVMRHELQSCNVTSRRQLFRVLRNIPAKRKLEGQDNDKSEMKKNRINEPRFTGMCYRCGLSGHRRSDCRRRRDDYSTASTNPTWSRCRTCFVCGQHGHLAMTCPNRKGCE